MALTEQEAFEQAQEAGLRYVTDEQPGYRRKRWGRGFTYLDPNGEHVQDSELREHFENLVIPPAWEEVWISPDPKGHMQATGRDEKGRKQYIYHPRWEETRNRNKFNRMLAFGRALPGLRARVDEDLGLRRLSEQKVLAIVVRLLDQTLIRIGNDRYARQNNSYGLTTLLNDHVDVEGSMLKFHFRGKSGKQVEVDLRNRRLARMVRRCQELPGQELFQYLDEEGRCCKSVRSEDVNRYLREETGEDFTAKDFRTWGGTVLAAQLLCEQGPVETMKEADKRVTQIVKQVAKGLGNTPAVCRAYYIHPDVLDVYRRGGLKEMWEQVQTGEEQSYFSNEEALALAVLEEALGN